jgi:hypothetical protein
MKPAKTRGVVDQKVCRIDDVNTLSQAELNNPC